MKNKNTFQDQVLEPLLFSFKQYAGNNAFCINNDFYNYQQFGETVSAIRNAVKGLSADNINIGLVANDDIETYAAIIALWLGVLLTAFFWEMWNYYSFPKWVYHVAWGNWMHIFEMPLLGYGGYLPFALELYALYHLMTGSFGEKTSNYIKVLCEK